MGIPPTFKGEHTPTDLRYNILSRWTDRLISLCNINIPEASHGKTRFSDVYLSLRDTSRESAHSSKDKRCQKAK